jgi:membrane protein involved in colicin uptake
MNMLRSRPIALLALQLGAIYLQAQVVMPTQNQPSFGQPSVGGNDIRNLRVRSQSADGSEVTLTLDYSYDGSSGSAARLLPVIAKKDQQKISSWFGADPVTIPAGHGTISIKVKFFNDEPGAPKELTTDRVRMLMLTDNGSSVIAQNNFTRTIHWGGPGSQPAESAEEARIREEAEAKRIDEEKAKLEAEAKVREQAAEARAKAEAEAKAREEAQLKAEQDSLAAIAKAKAEAEVRVREEARLKAEQEALAAAKAKAEAEVKAREEARLKVEQEALAAAKAKAEAEAKAREEAQLKAEQDRLAAIAKAKAEAEVRVREEARLKAEQEALAAAKAKAEAEVKAREEARLKVEQEALAAAKAKAEAEAKAREEAQLKAEQDRLAAIAKAKAETEARVREEARLKAEREALAAAKAKAEAEVKAREEARLKAEQEALAAAKAKAETEAKVRVSQPPPGSAASAFALSSAFRTKIVNVDIFSRTLDRTEMTISVDYDLSKEDGRPKMGVDVVSTDDPSVSGYFSCPAVDIGRRSHNTILFPVKLIAVAASAFRRATLPTDKIWIYLVDASGVKSYIFQSTMVLLWRVPGAANAGPAAAAPRQSGVQIESFKQNDLFGGYVIVKYNMPADGGRLHLRVVDSSNPSTEEWFANNDVSLKAGPGMQLVKIAALPGAKCPDVFKADTLEIQLLDEKGNILATARKDAAMTWAKRK